MYSSENITLISGTLLSFLVHSVSVPDIMGSRDLRRGSGTRAKLTIGDVPKPALQREWRPCVRFDAEDL